MPYSERIRYASFLDNQDIIEEGWDKKFGDRKNELVFIGQEMNEAEIRKQLENCLCTDSEIEATNLENGVADQWPLPRTEAIAE
jgi:hypothetical protein